MKDRIEFIVFPYTDILYVPDVTAEIMNCNG